MSTSVSAPYGASSDTPAVPPVVAVLVVHRPGPDFAETLAALASQDYPGLQFLVLVAGAGAAGSDARGDAGPAGSVSDMIATELPSAVVRTVGANPGFPSLANMVIDLVEGESGLFLFVHDDVAPAPDAVSRLVEEMYRTNAGVVGPKIVTWADPGVIESVGDDVDRLGARDPVAETGERDQEQHDAVRDAFAVSGACMLVRGDLFRTVGGFEPALQVCGADLDFCWRVHLAGARVVVAPSAVVRHRSATTSRLRGVDPLRLEDAEESERVATVLSLTPAGSLPLVVAAMFGSAVIRSITALVTGTPRRAWTPWRALTGVARRIGSIRDRRRRVSALRTVDPAEVRSLQILGSARIRRWWRLRTRTTPLEDRGTDIAGNEVVTTRRWSVVTWAVLVGLTVLGGRSILLHGTESVGQFVPFAGSASDHWNTFRAGWWPAGLGDGAFAPTGTALVAVLGAVTLGNMGLAHTLAIVGLPLVGYAGAWALAGVFAQRRARIVGTVAYAAVPLPYAAMSSGRWGALITYAALPWFVHHARQLVGHSNDPGSPGSLEFGPDGNGGVRVRRRRWAMLVLATAVAGAFEPGFLLVAAMTSTVLALGTTIGDGPRFALRWLGIGGGAVAGAALVNLPWSWNFVDGNAWNQLTGAAVTGGRDVGLASLARFDVGRVPFGGAFLLVYVVVIAAVMLVRGPRGPWATRGAVLAGVTMFFALLDDKALLPARLPEPAVVLAPVALGVSLACGALGASLALDVRRARFGWRQPLGAIASLAFVVALSPTALATVDGRWNQPSTTVVGLLEQLPSAEESGDYRVLFLGDPRLLPGSPQTVGWKVGWSVVSGASPTVRDAWEPTTSSATESVERAVRSIVRGSTARTGRLLAPFAVRYVVVPVVDGVVSTREQPLSGADALIGLLSDQLDLRRRYSSSEVAVFENVAWAPVRAQLTEAGAEASRSGGSVAVITGDVSGSQPVLAADPNTSAAVGPVAAGVVHVAVPFDAGWELSVGGRTFGARPAFGLTTAFDVDAGGDAVLSYRGSILRSGVVWLQVVAWVLLALTASIRRRGRLGLES